MLKTLQKKVQNLIKKNDKADSPEEEKRRKTLRGDNAVTQFKTFSQEDGQISFFGMLRVD